MSYRGQNYSRLLGMPGFTDESMNIHFKLYEGYVGHFNEMIDILNGTDRDNPAYDAIKEKFAWDFNGVRLHEAYFGNLTKDYKALNPDSGLAREMVKTYGSLESWANDFWEVSSTRGAGWAVLAWDPEGKSLINLWIKGHEVGTLFYCVSLLVNDCFDHAYMTDYGDDRSDYAEAFLKVIDWVEVQKRFDSVVQLSREAEYAL
jgi:superoxide dismutase, Fe-Mn family